MTAKFGEYEKAISWNNRFSQ